MLETTSATVGINIGSTLVGGTGVVLLGIQTGLDGPTLLAGVLGGALGLSYTEKASILRRIVEVISAALVAGYWSPPIAEITMHLLRERKWIAADAGIKPAIQASVAVLLAFLAHGVILPGLVAKARERAKLRRKQ